ncbi:hypothetical protein M9980_09800 [Sphingomonas donggukensis]|uniref:Polysaccharide biosynthesis protein n=1 Tax=Sphingomonas donggukensis TaxID=2949093 RepID=A0ABY4TSF6_9SPHN|nr:ATP-grasp fold amidoligase family protein [Sphingomonas donggukensis]URW74859.1 hypothetical protein M9980_09800 [Sphingomonas donggukensis]
MRFTELVQWRKLNDRNPSMPGLIDKVAVKAFVSDRIGAEWITPTLWHGSLLPDTPPWPHPFVVKSRHGCNQRRFVLSDATDWTEVRRAGARWVWSPYGRWLDEWGYADVPRGILVEPFIGTAGVLPIDYKLYVFHGHVAAIQVHLDRARDHRWLLMDRDWLRLSRSADTPPRPARLGAMIAAAEQLGIGFDFVRIDFYDIDPHPRFGEMTFYPGSGLDPFDPLDLDDWLGRLWREGA